MILSAQPLSIMQEAKRLRFCLPALSAVLRVNLSSTILSTMNLLVQLFIYLLAILQKAIAQENIIDVPPGGLVVTAGQPFTITWSNPSSGTVTIKLQQGSAITPTSGTVVASGSILFPYSPVPYVD